MRDHSNIKTTLLKNGVGIKTEYVSYVETCCIGVWLDIGSRDETKLNNGVAHFFEHLVFKGTNKRTGLEIVKCIESKGGQINAFTTKENTCFYIKIVHTELALAVDVLLDMVFLPSLKTEDVTKEKEVVIEEIKGCDDNPDDRVYELFGPALYGSQSVGFPIAGTEESVSGLNRSHLQKHLNRIKETAPIYITCAGKVNHEDLVGQLTNFFKKNPLSKSGSPRKLSKRKSTFFNIPEHVNAKMKIQQINVMMGGPGYDVADPMLIALTLVNAIVGDGMSSKLFQKLREELGCVYNINSFLDGMVGTGTFGLSFSMDPDSVKTTMKAINDVFLEIKQKAFSEDDLIFAKEYVKGNFLIENESIQNRMVFLARTIMYGGPIGIQKEYLKAIDDITLTELRQAWNDVSDSKTWGIATVGPGSVGKIKGMMKF